MNIALIGYGKMGKTIETLGIDQGHQFPLIVDLENSRDLNEDSVMDVDVAIEFTVPREAPDNIRKCIDLGLPVVSGTTGWNDRYNEVVDYCRKLKGAFFYASNFSIGVNILMALNDQLATIMNRFSSYRISLEEVHHQYKLDKPSGTAISLADQITGRIRRVKGWSMEQDEDPFTMYVDVKREGEVKGKHTVRYESELDALTLTHEAKSRDAFAAGALQAAKFIKEKSGVFGMKDLLKL